MDPQPVDPSRWRFDVEAWPAHDDCIAIGGDLEPGTIIEAYRNGAFPMPLDHELAWWSPVRRGVLLPGDLWVSRSLRRSARALELTYDTDFAGVVRGCADSNRPGGWISPEIEAAYVRLHELGWAHSVETRDADGALVGGLYGLQVGRLFAGESMFHRARDASKVALMGLVELQPEGLIDVQWRTPHLATLGVTELDRAGYLRRIADLVDQPSPHWPPPKLRAG
ncbi:MAG TPA: leucyl/phenylalanyl-tRNA--protein transferase [Aeromicrobium sp.]|nr:leucyl/phenylalanyl-tRNA--protein transferase [Aeromicrobium sp.]